MTYYPKTKLQTINDNTPQQYQWRGNKKQKLAMQLWISPTSETFGNAYQSFKLAGFSESYSKNAVSQAPKWLSEYINRLDFTDEHIKQGLQQLAQAAPDSRSPDDTRLKAYEILAKVKGLIDNKHPTTNILVQPILGGQSATPPKKVINQVVEE